ncbi:UDP binding domain-containing protein [Francisella sciaenopsi]|uniref:UDP-glucose/GDP-mannose dehydrogenase C-terminal domain-containing protein n=1 Tax=Francisella sciaenopsi TaxID=3055034 RepID=A0ABQ6PHI4_9GAMM
MKANFDNFRSSAVHSIISKLVANNVKVVICEPIIKVTQIDGLQVISDVTEFKTISDVIVVNRMSNDLINVKNKLYTRDIFGRDS